MSNSPCSMCGNYGHSKEECAAPITIIEWRHNPDASSVHVLLSSDNWQIERTLAKVNDHITKEEFYQIKQSLPYGNHQYKFKIILHNNKVNWECDYNKPVINDNFGGYNNFVEVFPFIKKDKFKFDINVFCSDISDDEDQSTDYNVNREIIDVELKLSYEELPEKLKQFDSDNSHEMLILVEVLGAWDGWKKKICLERKCSPFDGSQYFSCKISLKEGTYEYKFVCDDIWFVDMSKQTNSESGHINNVFTLNNYNEEERVNDILFPLSNIKHLFMTTIEIEDMPQFKIEGHTTVSIGDSLYVFGGCRVGGGYRNQMHEIDIMHHKLIQNPDENSAAFAPGPRAFHKAFAFGSKIIYYGGLNESKIYNSYCTYNTTTQKWTQVKTINTPTPREHFTFNLANDINYGFLFGGYYCTPDLEAEYNYNQLFSFNLKTLTWVYLQIPMGKLPKGRCMHCSQIINGVLWLFGGKWMFENNQEIFGDLWSIDLNESTDYLKWNAEDNCSGKVPTKRYAAAHTSFRDKLVIHGGNDENDRTLDDMYIFCVSNMNWTKVEIHFDKNQVERPIIGRYHHTIEVAGKNIYILGGKHTDHSKDVHVSFALHKLSLE